MTAVTAFKALLAIAFWGASFIATKIALREVSPLTVVVLRFGLGVAVITALVAWRREPHRARPDDLGWLALLGLNGVTVHQLLQSHGLVTTTAINSGWIVALIPIFTAILARLIVREPFGARKAAGLAIATLGAALIIGRGTLSAGLIRRAAPGDLLVLVSAANWALFTTLSKRMTGRYPPAVQMAYVMTFGWLLSLPLFALIGGWQDIPGMSAGGWWAVAFLGVGCSGLAYTFWYDALAEAEASAVASFLYLQPLVTVAVARVVLGETVTGPMLAGGLAILAGVWLVNQAGAARGRFAGEPRPSHPRD